jgi:hypothetical protein
VKVRRFETFARDRIVVDQAEDWRVKKFEGFFAFKSSPPIFQSSTVNNAGQNECSLIWLEGHSVL